MSLHIRKKRNKSGSISIQIIDRKNRGYKVVKSVGCAKNQKELDILLYKAKIELEKIRKNLYPSLFDNFEEKEELLIFEALGNNELIPIGDELIFGKLFEDIGCKGIFLKQKLRNRELKEKIFKSLVISRLLYPGSKLYLIDYLHYFKKEEIEVDTIYRLLDSLYSNEIKLAIEKCIFNHTMKIINNQLIIAFYDVTTLHFENESEDDFRKIGFSKEGKLNRPQIQLGLLTTLEGYPLAYEVYEGNRFEGKTLIETLVNFEKRFSLKQKPIIVADRGMLSNCNLIELHKKGYRYIIGSRIKALKDEIKTEIANLVFISDQDTKEIALDEELICREKNKIIQKAKIPQRIILSYSTQRLKKDNYLRKKGIEKLKNKIQTSPNITKSDLKLSPYAKFLDLISTNKDCSTILKLNEEEILQDEKLDGIKGFITNDFSLSHQDIINHYKNLWHIEKAFKISKTDIRIRPIYHRLEHRIKAHILIAFVSYTIYKEFERRLQINNVQLHFSKKILRDIIKHMFAINIDGKLHYLKFDNIQQIIINSIY